MSDPLPPAPESTADERAGFEAARDPGTVLVLTPAEQSVFVALLLDPPPLAPALLRAREAHRRLFGG